MGALDQQLKLLITGDATGLSSAFRRAETDIKGFSSSASRSISSVQTAFAALGVTLSAGAFAASIKKSVDAMDDLYKASQKVGVSVESLSALKYAAQLSDVSFEDLTKSLKIFNRTLDDARTGSKDAYKALLQVGVAVTDSTETALLKVATAFQKLPDGAQKTALAMRLFGRAGADMIPFLNGGADGIARLTAEAEKFGIIISTKAAKAAEEFNDSLTRLGREWEGIKIAVAGPIVEWLQTLVIQFNAGRDAAGGFFAAIAKFGLKENDPGAQINRLLEQRARLESTKPTPQLNVPMEKLTAQRKADIAEINKELEYWKALQARMVEVSGVSDEIYDKWDALAKRGKETAKTVGDAWLESTTNVRSGFKKLADDLRASMDAMAASKAIGPLAGKSTETSNVLDINRLKDIAQTLLEKGDYEAALKATKQAAKINDYLLENKQISESYYNSQSQDLQAFAQAAEQFIGENPPTAEIAIDGEASDANLEAYRALMQQFLDQNPLYQNVKMIPQGATDESGASITEGVPQLLPVPGIYAAGGHITGPGTATSDSILARLSAGEYVVRAAAVKAYGLGFLERLNSMRMPKFGFGGLVPAFAGGGSTSTPVHLHLGGESIGPMSAGADVAAQLKRVMRTEVLKRGRR